MRVGVILLGSTERRRDSTVSTRNGSIPTVVVDVLDADVATEKRAQWEAFEFIILGDGDVEVVNDRRNERGWSAPSGIRTRCRTSRCSVRRGSESLPCALLALTSFTREVLRQGFEPWSLP
jgi:hypothetical protein